MLPRKVFRVQKAKKIKGRHTQVVKGAVCKTAIRRFKSACRLQFFESRFSTAGRVPGVHPETHYTRTKV
jgi:hypothetical protein